MAVSEDSVGLWNSWLGSSGRSLCGRQYQLWRSAVHRDRRCDHAAVGVCKAQLCVLRGVHVLSVYGMETGSESNGDGGAACADPGAFQGSGKCVYLLYYLSVYAVCGYIQLAVSDSRLSQRLSGWCGGLWTVPACPGPSDGMERSVVRY